MSPFVEAGHGRSSHLPQSNKLVELLQPRFLTINGPFSNGPYNRRVVVVGSVGHVMTVWRVGVGALPSSPMIPF
ncbi:MAG: hypothetical protein JW846_05215 [Dehalococcoidia bacterium]|nr:hypothetical protein [Dehalococcoidia bacterium]